MRGSPGRAEDDLRVPVFPLPGADLTVTEASSSDGRGERAELYGHVDEGLLGGEASYLGPPLTPEKDEALHQATAVANLRAALMSKNSLLSLKADVLGDDSSLLLEYLPKGTHSLSRKCRPVAPPRKEQRGRWRRGGRGGAGGCAEARGRGAGEALATCSRGDGRCLLECLRRRSRHLSPEPRPGWRRGRKRSPGLWGGGRCAEAQARAPPAGPPPSGLRGWGARRGPFVSAAHAAYPRPAARASARSVSLPLQCVRRHSRLREHVTHQHGKQPRGPLAAGAPGRSPPPPARGLRAFSHGVPARSEPRCPEDLAWGRCAPASLPSRGSVLGPGGAHRACPTERSRLRAVGPWGGGRRSRGRGMGGASGRTGAHGA